MKPHSVTVYPKEKTVQATTAKWVSRLNKLAREMDELAATLHPSAWHEALAPYCAKYKRLAQGAPRE
jgi:hypothetical protein